MNRLEGAVVVLTCAARADQGAAEAAALAREGATVIATDVTPAPGCRRLGATDAGAWAGLAASTRDEHGRVDGLVNNAGITRRARLSGVGRDDERWRSRWQPGARPAKTADPLTRPSRLDRDFEERPGARRLDPPQLGVKGSWVQIPPSRLCEVLRRTILRGAFCCGPAALRFAAVRQG